jgi:hypothetical protein
VRTAEQNGGKSIRLLGARRIVLAFDPMSDNPDLVRMVVIVMLLRTAPGRLYPAGPPPDGDRQRKIAEAVSQLADSRMLRRRPAPFGRTL